MWREWKTEWMKVRGRKVGLLILGFLFMSFVWVNWSLGKADEQELWDGYRMLFLQLPLLDTVLLPTMMAMLGSRLCDAEVKGNTLKLLCTMERKGRLFDMKLLTGSCYLGIFVAAQVGMIFLLGMLYGFGRPLSPVQMVYFILNIFLVSLAILLLQELLSFFFENQIIPLAVGLLGSFIGLFSWFFAGLPLRVVFLWSYYSLLGFIRYTWEESTRITTYYDARMDIRCLCLLLVLMAAGYGIGKYMFVRREL